VQNLSYPTYAHDEGRDSYAVGIRFSLNACLEIHLLYLCSLDAEQVKSYARDLRNLLNETDIVKSKAFLRSFVEKIVIRGTTGTVYYKLPVPAQWQEKEDVVLPIVPPSGPFGTVPELLFEKKGLVEAIWQLLASSFGSMSSQLAQRRFHAPKVKRTIS